MCRGGSQTGRAMSFAPARRQPWRVTGQATISGDVQRASCVCQSQTSSLIALKPHSASRGLVRSFGACCRRLTGFTDIDPSRVVARKRVVTTNSVSMPLRPPAIGPIRCASRSDRSSGRSPSIKPMTAWVQPSCTPRAAPPASSACAAGGPSRSPICARSSGGTGTPTLTTTSGIDACRRSGMATRPELAGSVTAKLSANWSLPGPLSVRRP
jgi:hypothetical protein